MIGELHPKCSANRNNCGMLKLRITYGSVDALDKAKWNKEKEANELSKYLPLSESTQFTHSIDPLIPYIEGNSLFCENDADFREFTNYLHVQGYALQDVLMMQPTNLKATKTIEILTFMDTTDPIPRAFSLSASPSATTCPIPNDEIGIASALHPPEESISYANYLLSEPTQSKDAEWPVENMPLVENDATNAYQIFFELVQSDLDLMQDCYEENKRRIMESLRSVQAYYVEKIDEARMMDSLGENKGRRWYNWALPSIDSLHFFGKEGAASTSSEPANMGETSEDMPITLELPVLLHERKNSLSISHVLPTISLESNTAQPEQVTLEEGIDRFFQWVSEMAEKLEGKALKPQLIGISNKGTQAPDICSFLSERCVSISDLLAKGLEKTLCVPTISAPIGFVNELSNVDESSTQNVPDGELPDASSALQQLELFERKMHMAEACSKPTTGVEETSKLGRHYTILCNEGNGTDEEDYTHGGRFADEIIGHGISTTLPHVQMLELPLLTVSKYYPNDLDTGNSPFSMENYETKDQQKIVDSLLENAKKIWEHDCLKSLLNDGPFDTEDAAPSNAPVDAKNFPMEYLQYYEIAPTIRTLPMQRGAQHHAASIPSHIESEISWEASRKTSEALQPPLMQVCTVLDDDEIEAYAILSQLATCVVASDSNAAVMSTQGTAPLSLSVASFADIAHSLKSRERIIHHNAMRTDASVTHVGERKAVFTSRQSAFLENLKWIQSTHQRSKLRDIDETCSKALMLARNCMEHLAMTSRRWLLGEFEVTGYTDAVLPVYDLANAKVRRQIGEVDDQWNPRERDNDNEMRSAYNFLDEDGGNTQENPLFRQEGTATILAKNSGEKRHDKDAEEIMPTQDRKEFNVDATKGAIGSSAQMTYDSQSDRQNTELVSGAGENEHDMDKFLEAAIAKEGGIDDETNLQYESQDSLLDIVPSQPQEERKPLSVEMEWADIVEQIGYNEKLEQALLQANNVEMVLQIAEKIPSVILIGEDALQDVAFVRKLQERHSLSDIADHRVTTPTQDNRIDNSVDFIGGNSSLPGFHVVERTLQPPISLLLNESTGVILVDLYEILDDAVIECFGSSQSTESIVAAAMEYAETIQRQQAENSAGENSPSAASRKRNRSQDISEKGSTKKNKTVDGANTKNPKMGEYLGADSNESAIPECLQKIYTDSEYAQSLTEKAKQFVRSLVNIAHLYPHLVVIVQYDRIMRMASKIESKRKIQQKIPDEEFLIAALSETDAQIAPISSIFASYLGLGGFLSTVYIGTLNFPLPPSWFFAHSGEEAVSCLHRIHKEQVTNRIYEELCGSIEIEPSPARITRRSYFSQQMRPYFPLPKEMVTQLAHCILQCTLRPWLRNIPEEIEQFLTKLYQINALQATYLLHTFGTLESIFLASKDEIQSRLSHNDAFPPSTRDRIYTVNQRSFSNSASILHNTTEETPARDFPHYNDAHSTHELDSHPEGHTFSLSRAWNWNTSDDTDYGSGNYITVPGAHAVSYQTRDQVVDENAPSAFGESLQIETHASAPSTENDPNVARIAIHNGEVLATGQVTFLPYRGNNEEEKVMNGIQSLNFERPVESMECSEVYDDFPAMSNVTDIDLADQGTESFLQTRESFPTGDHGFLNSGEINLNHLLSDLNESEIKAMLLPNDEHSDGMYSEEKTEQKASVWSNGKKTEPAAHAPIPSGPRHATVNPTVKFPLHNGFYDNQDVSSLLGGSFRGDLETGEVVASSEAKENFAFVHYTTLENMHGIPQSPSSSSFDHSWTTTSRSPLVQSNSPSDSLPLKQHNYEFRLKKSSSHASSGKENASLGYVNQSYMPSTMSSAREHGSTLADVMNGTGSKHGKFPSFFAKNGSIKVTRRFNFGL